MLTPHPDLKPISAQCAVITISDTRTSVTDKSGKITQDLLVNEGHQILIYSIVKDEPEIIEQLLKELGNNQSLNCIIFNGGTGISHRDNTYETLVKNIDKIIPGFGEIFRFLSYQEIGSRAIASRALAGIYQGKLVFSLPGSTGAVKLGVEKLIIPELNHLLTQIS